MIQKSFVLLFVCLLLTGISRSQSTQQVRSSQLFNFGWKFYLGDPAHAEAPDFDDTGWTAVDLPHDYQINLPWVKEAGSARGFKENKVGWYRKVFRAERDWKQRKVLLDFEGIMLHGDAWLNGQKIGGTDYGYLGFEADITRLLRYGGDNVLAVRAATDGASRWYTGGGLFRDVHLILRSPVAVARDGIYITTPEISSVAAQVAVQVELEGIRNKTAGVSLQVEIRTPDGKLAGTAKTSAPKYSKTHTAEILLPRIEVAAPRLWSCEAPHLYQAIVTVWKDQVMVDQVTEKFGIRQIEFSKEFGFKLNGKKVFLKGIANHHDLGAVGVAAYERAIARQMDQLKAFGFNHIRTSHNPYSRAFLRLADEKGILIVDELYDKWSNKSYWVGRKPWTELWPQNLRDWIKRDRNHPSVILWSFGNELQMREDLAGYPTGDWGVTSYRLLQVMARRYDSTRMTTVAMFPARAGGMGKSDRDFNTYIVPPELATITDVASFNYRWYNYAEYLKHAPDMNIYQSEASTNELAQPFFGMDRDKMVGLAYWGAIEYWGESNGWPKKGWSYAFFNNALEPFPQAYLIKSLFSDQPVVHIGIVDSAAQSQDWNDQTIGTMNVSDHWNREKGKSYNVYTFTNAEEVELLVNGKSLGVQTNPEADIKQRNMILWKQVSYAPGRIEAIAHNGGKEVARHWISTTGPAVALQLEAEQKDFKADGMDLNYLKVYAVDRKGNRVYTAAPVDVHFELEGAAKLIAVDNADHFSDELFNGTTRRLYRGFAMGIIRSERQKGEIRVKVTAEGLRAATLKMSTD